MNNTEILEIVQETMLIIIKISLPVLLVGLVVGVAIALVQALTQIQEITLVFVPKIVAIFFSMFLFMPWMMGVLIAFTEELADRIVGGGL